MLLAVDAITTPELIGVLGSWSVAMAAPLILVRRRRRRRVISAAHQVWADARPLTRLKAPAGDPTAAAGNEDRSDSWRPSSSLRLSPGTLEPLCRYVDFRRRLEVAVSELERLLGQLPRDRWRVEPCPLTGERRNSLLVLGETGVFVISATHAPGHWDDVVAVSKLAAKVQLLLPGYLGQVQAAICHPFAAVRPRLWYRADDHCAWIGAWLVGADSVIEWLLHFGTEHGLGVGDLVRFDQRAKPNWLKEAIPTPPSWPPIPAQASTTEQE